MTATKPPESDKGASPAPEKTKSGPPPAPVRSKPSLAAVTGTLEGPPFEPGTPTADPPAPTEGPTEVSAIHSLPPVPPVVVPRPSGSEPMAMFKSEVQIAAARKAAIDDVLAVVGTQIALFKNEDVPRVLLDAEQKLHDAADKEYARLKVLLETASPEALKNAADEVAKEMIDAYRAKLEEVAADIEKAWKASKERLRAETEATDESLRNLLTRKQEIEASMNQLRTGAVALETQVRSGNELLERKLQQEKDQLERMLASSERLEEARGLIQLLETNIGAAEQLRQEAEAARQAWAWANTEAQNRLAAAANIGQSFINEAIKTGERLHKEGEKARADALADVKKIAKTAQGGNNTLATIAITILCMIVGAIAYTQWGQISGTIKGWRSAPAASAAPSVSPIPESSSEVLDIGPNGVIRKSSKNDAR